MKDTELLMESKLLFKLILNPDYLLSAFTKYSNSLPTTGFIIGGFAFISILVVHIICFL